MKQRGPKGRRAGARKARQRGLMAMPSAAIPTGMQRNLKSRLHGQPNKFRKAQTYLGEVPINENAPQRGQGPPVSRRTELPRGVTLCQVKPASAAQRLRKGRHSERKCEGAASQVNADKFTCFAKAQSFQGELPIFKTHTRVDEAHRFHHIGLTRRSALEQTNVPA